MILSNFCQHQHKFAGALYFLMAAIPWSEKYRPRTLAEVCGHTATIRALTEMVARRRFPHLLLFGPPGTGKTSIAVNLVREAHPGVSLNKSCLHLNASDERGLDTIRTRIRDFVEANIYTHIQPKFIILDEAENMTEQAQMSLRTFLDADIVAHGVCFIFIANYLTKIHPDLLSRFVRFRLPPLDYKTMAPRLLSIAHAEGFTDVTTAEVETNCLLYTHDMRHQIQRLQRDCMYPSEKRNIAKVLKFTTLPLLQNQVAIYLEQYEIDEFLTAIVFLIPPNPRFVKKANDFRLHSQLLHHDARVAWLARIIYSELSSHSVAAEVSTIDAPKTC